MRETTTETQTEGLRSNAARAVWFEFVNDAYRDMKRAGLDGANGAAFVPGFDYDAYSQLETREEKDAFEFEFTSELLRKTPEEITEMSNIARQNLEALKDSGMSVEEIAEANQSELFNMSGMKPKSERENGDIEDMFSVEDVELPEGFHVNKNRGLKKYTEGSLADLADAFTVILGFDMSTSMVPGMKSGISYLRKKTKHNSHRGRSESRCYSFDHSR